MKKDYNLNMINPKYIRLVSDLHLDVDWNSFRETRILNKNAPKIRCEMDMLHIPKSLETDNETIMIIAGDIWKNSNFYTLQDKDGLTWLEKIASKFQYIVIVLGNHDYWGCNLLQEPIMAKDAIKLLNLKNVFLLEDDVLSFDNVKFVGSTLWTSFDNNNPIVKLIGHDYMADYRTTSFSVDENRNMTPDDLVSIHNTSKQFIFDNIQKDNNNQKIIVITHMAPSYQSVHEMYRTPKDLYTNHLFYSELSNEISYSDIDYWLHGHVHHPFNYHINKTNVICNPRGYAGYENNGYNETLLIKI